MYEKRNTTKERGSRGGGKRNNIFGKTLVTTHELWVKAKLNFWILFCFSLFTLFDLA